MNTTDLLKALALLLERTQSVDAISYSIDLAPKAIRALMQAVEALQDVQSRLCDDLRCIPEINHAVEDSLLSISQTLEEKV